MKHIKTYESVIGNIWFEIFSNKYVKRIVSNMNKLLKDNTDTFKWEYEDINSIFLRMTSDRRLNGRFLAAKYNTRRYIEIKAESQWLQIRIVRVPEIDKIDYLESLLIKYGDLHNTDYNAFFNNYYLTLPNAEKLINELNMDDFLTSKNIIKFNL